MLRRSMLLLLLLGLEAGARPPQDAAETPGRRVLSAGHSFHVFMPGILADVARAARIDGHVQVDVQSIGGSRVIQHWDLADEKNRAKKALAAGGVDVLTLSPIYLPDDGIARFTQLALEKNPAVRVTVQEFWLPHDVFDVTRRKVAQVDRDAVPVEELRKRHAPYFKMIDDHVRELNAKHGKAVVFVVPTGQAVLRLREKIVAGEAPGLTSQADLFTDAIGHVRAPVQALTAYGHFAVIYRRTPVGLPVPAVLAKAKLPEEERLNRLLQELAWEAVVAHPLSGVTR